MDEEVHERTYVAVVQTVLKLFCYRCLRFIRLVCTWRIWTCKDASQLCLLEHVTHPTPVDVSLPMYSFLTFIQLSHSSMSYLLFAAVVPGPAGR